MKLSLQRRIQLSFLLSIALVAGIGVTSFYYLNQLNEEVQQIIENDIGLSHSGQKIQEALVSLRRRERIFLLNPETPDFQSTMKNNIDELQKVVEEGRELSAEKEIKKLHQDVLNWLQDYHAIISATEIPFDPRRLVHLLDEPMTKIRQTVAKIEKLHHANLEAHRLEAQQLSDSSNRNMILMVITTILAGLLIGFFAPSKVVLPFRKLQAAIHEVQAANFNVSVNISGNDEIAELGREFNKMVEEIRVFDDMKIKKIAFEKRKLDTLANMVGAGIIIISIEGEILYMNRSLYEMLGVTSERVIHTSVDASALPDELKILFRESIDRKDRFEDRKWDFTYKDSIGNKRRQSVQVSFSPVRNHVGDIVNFVIAMRGSKIEMHTQGNAPPAASTSDIGDTW